MSQFIDYGNIDFEGTMKSNFVDKSGLIEFLNSAIEIWNFNEPMSLALSPVIILPF